ncbi:MAG: hypothetical protein IKB03_00155 [Tidjanibacter sp.]|nr:hypothetical protein [Tidjanibacter sp.]
MKRLIYILAALLLTCVNGYAQEEGGFSKEIEVQKEYEIVVRGAERIEYEIELLDTTIVRPELNYRITPTAHVTEFDVQPLNPIGLSTARWAKPSKLYLNVGAGLPLQSELDLYWSPVRNEREHLSVRVNHEGYEGSATNLDGERLGALLMRNVASVDYASLIGDYTSLSAAVNYRGWLGESYGGVAVSGERGLMSTNDVEANLNVSGRFSRESVLHYDANAMGLYAWNNAQERVGRFNFNFGLLGLDSLRSWLPGRVTLHYSGVESVCQSPYFDTSVTFVPEWNFRVGRWLPVELMAGYDYMVYRGANNTLNGVVSSIKLSYDRFAALTPYVTVANDVQTKATRDGLWRSPYMAMLPVDSRKIFLAELGATGSVGEVTYGVSGATRWFSTYMFECVEEGSPRLAYGVSKGQRVWYAEAKAEWRPTWQIAVGAKVKYVALGAAESVDAEFRPRNWQTLLEGRWRASRRLTLGASAAWASKMEVTRIGAAGRTMMEVPSYVDLGVEADYKWSHSTSLWLRGDNLLSQPIYHWATYAAPGASVRMGVRMAF